MSEGLTTEQALSHETMWRYMQRLQDRLFGVFDSETVMDDCLDIVVDLLGADRGLILLTFLDGTTQAINARGHKRSLDPVEREEISKTIIRQAQDSGKCIQWDPLAVESASSSVLALGIWAALAAPLQRPGSTATRGVLYVDLRDKRKFLEPRHVEFFMSAAVLIGAMFEQQGRSQTTRDHLLAAEAHCVESRRTPPLGDLLAHTAMQPIRREVESVLHSNLSILILGESGTGKTLLAQAIAEASGRRPIVRAVLGSSDDLNTITSELFGHEKGAFSGATGRRVGLVEFANKGTLVLDEILNLPPHAQKLLLDFTQFGDYRPLGYEKPQPKRASVRIIGATNGDLAAAVKDGRFRLDLYHRLAGITLELPPLRERRGDIPSLAEATLGRVDPSRGWTLAVALRRLLLSPAIHWSGNVRQLEHVILRARERALARDPSTTVLGPENLEPRDIDGASVSDVAPAAPSPASLATTWQGLQDQRTQIEDREQTVILDALARTGGVVAHAARELGIARTTLSSRIDALGIRPSRRERSESPPRG